ncbi:MAG TPA: ABC transporter ATP-binding protein [Acidimicrobiales bacterium]|nr:ABC transporter ATP-binding protein [Acidimicrobiales bacterium]
MSTAPLHRARSARKFPEDGQPALRFSGVVHKYRSLVALDHLDLEVARGETIALLGPNGAGKSTAISLLLGLQHVQEGEVSVLGTSPRAAMASGKVGAILQVGGGSGLPHGVKVGSLVAMASRLYKRPAPVEKTLARAGLTELADRQTQRLSGGQAQRVRFALAIAGDPELVFLDEPTVAMDVDGRRTFWRMMRLFAAEGRTVVFATHHLDEADAVADRIVVMRKGTVVANGCAATIKAAVPVRRLRFVADLVDQRQLRDLDGVDDVTVRGSEVILDSLDADATVRALVAAGVRFSDIEIRGADLEQAFVLLTSDLQTARTVADAVGETAAGERDAR